MFLTISSLKSEEEQFKFTALAALLKKLLFCFLLFCYLLLALRLRQTWYHSALQKSYDGNETAVTANHYQITSYRIRDQPFPFRGHISNEVRNEAVAKNTYFSKHIVETVPPGSLPDPMIEKYFKKKKISIDFPVFFKHNGTVKVALIGNSYAHRASYSINPALSDEIMELRVLSHGGCNPFFGSYYKHQHCDQFFNASLELLEEFRPDIIYAIYLSFDPFSRKIKNLDNDEPLKWMQLTVDRFQSIAKSVVVQYPTPVDMELYMTPLLIKKLRNSAALEEVQLSFKKFWSRERYMFARLDAISCQNCTRIYPHRFFCDGKVCHTYDCRNFYSFYDSSMHLSQYGLEVLQPLYRKIFNEMLAKRQF